MKIVYLHTTVFPSNSPSASFVTYYTHALAAAGAETHLVVQRPQDGGDVNDVLRTFFGLEPLPTLTVHALGGARAGRGGGRASYYRQVAHLLRHDPRLANPDLVITRSLSLLPTVLRFKARMGARRVFFETHDFFADFGKSHSLNVSGIRKGLRERWYLPRTDGILCLQPSQMELYRRVFPTCRLVHLPTGCRTFAAAPALPVAHPFTVVYVGSLDPHKGVGDLLNLWAQWPEAPRLRIIGGTKAAHVEAMRAEVARLGAGDRVELIAWKAPGDLPPYLQDADVGVLPLRDTFFNRHLTFPLKMMDYMAAGLPIIAKRLPTTESVLEHGVDSLLVDAFDPATVRAAVDALRGDPARYRQLKEGMARKATAYSWRRRAEKTFALV